MLMLDAIERKGLFRFTRFLSFAIILLLCIMIFFSVSFYGSIEPTTYVSMEDIKASSSTSSSQPGLSFQQNAQDVPIPPEVDKYLASEDNRKIAQGWVSGLDVEQKKDFFSNLSLLVQEGERKNENVTDIINAYRSMKLAKLSTTQWEKYAQQVQKGATILFVSILLGMVGLFSLVLVLLAIERNTRPAQSYEKGPTSKLVFGAASLKPDDVTEADAKQEFPNEEDMLPEKVNCPSCGEELELNEKERAKRKFICPECKTRINLTQRNK